MKASHMNESPSTEDIVDSHHSQLHIHSGAYIQLSKMANETICMIYINF